MIEVIKSNRFTIDGVAITLKICRSASQVLFLSMEQEKVGFDTLTTEMHVDVLDGFIRKLQDFSDDIKNIQLIVDDSTIKSKDIQPIISTFLKGITIKDLSLQFRYKEAAIRNLLLKHNIEIIEGIKPFERSFYFKKKRK
jgi:hypothetical protein